MKVLINRSDSMSEVIFTMPMAKMIKEHFPDAKITMLVKAHSADLFINHPYIDDFKVYHRNARFFYKFKEIIQVFKEVRPTHYFYAGGGYFPNFISWIFRVPFRGGLKSRWHTYLFLNQGIRQKRSMVTMHEMEYNLNLLSPLGIDYNYKEKDHFSPEIYLNQDEFELNQNIFKKNLLKEGIPPERKYIFIHPGLSGDTLNWTSRNFGRLILKFEQKFPDKYLYVISHSHSDHLFLQGIKEILSRKENQFLKNRYYFFDGKKEGLRNYMAVLAKAELYIGPSTGPTHIAAIMGIPLVTLFSPIKNQSSLRWGPLAKNNNKNENNKLRILIPDVICGEVKKCALKKCPYYECMGKIEVEDVFKQALGVLN